VELEIDRRQPAPQPIRPLEPSHLWILGLAMDDDGSIVGPGARRPSYWAECECPGDCLRDHENE